MDASLDQIPANAFQLKAIQRLLEQEADVSPVVIEAVQEQRDVLQDTYQNAVFDPGIFDEIETALERIQVEYEESDDTLMEAVGLMPDKVEQRETARTEVRAFVDAQLSQMEQRRSRTGGRIE